MHPPARRSRIDPAQVSILSLSAALTQLHQWRLEVVLHFPFNKHPSGLILACGFTFGNDTALALARWSGRPLVAALLYCLFATLDIFFSPL